MIASKVQKQPKPSKAAAAQSFPAIPATELPSGCASQDQIREWAFRIYEGRGSEPGHDVQDWLHAERQIQAR